MVASLPIKKSSAVECTIGRTVNIWQLHTDVRLLSTWYITYVSHATLENSALRRYDFDEMI